jgi:plasmid stability protein
MADIQIRNFPDDLRRDLKARAASEGRSLGDYVIVHLRRTLDHPPRHEVLRRIADRSPVELNQTVADLVRAERDAR